MAPPRKLFLECVVLLFLSIAMLTLSDDNRYGDADSWTVRIDTEKRPLLESAGCGNKDVSTSECTLRIYHNMHPSKSACNAAKPPSLSSYTTSWTESEGCVMRCYRGRYTDLQNPIFSDQVLQAHYKNHGAKEGRNCKCDVQVRHPVALSVAELSSKWDDSNLQNSGTTFITVNGQQVLDCSWATYQQKWQKLMVMGGRGHFLSDTVGSGNPPQCTVSRDYQNDPASGWGTSCALRYTPSTKNFIDMDGVQHVDDPTRRLVTCRCHKYSQCFPKNVTGAETYSARSAAAVTMTYINETAYIKNHLGFYEYVAQPDAMVCRNAKKIQCSPDAADAVLTVAQSTILHGLKQMYATAC